MPDARELDRSQRGVGASVCVIGLGNLGSALGRRMFTCGATVIGVDVSAAARQSWRAATDLEAVSNLAEVGWARLESVFVVVRTWVEARSVLQRLSEMMPHTDQATCFVVTTLDPNFAGGLGGLGPRLRVVELPVSGGAAGALAGNLTVLAAGPLSVRDEELLRATIATAVVRFDKYGAPTTAKLLNNLVAGFNARALAEALLLGDSLGLDASILHGVISASSGGSWIAGGFMELLDATLAKDVIILRDYVGSIPALDVAASDEFLRCLAAARKLLAGAPPEHRSHHTEGRTDGE